MAPDLQQESAVPAAKSSTAPVPEHTMRDAAAPRPSDRAVERLAGGVEGDLQVLRGTLHRALDEAERFAAEGRGDLAAAVVDEQRTILLAFHRRLEERVAEAAVEREAELVVGATEPVAGPTPAIASAGVADGALRLVAAAVAAVVGVGLLASSTTLPGELTAAGTADEQQDTDAPGPPADGGQPTASTGGAVASTPQTAEQPARTDATAAPADVSDLGPVATRDQQSAPEGERSPAPDDPAVGPFDLQVLPPAVADGLPGALPEPDRPALPRWTEGPGRAER